jgi:hypothetical protein
MYNEIILMLHPTFGVLGMLSAVWLLVEVLNAGERNAARIRCAALGIAVLVWLSYLAGGYWYVNYYAADKAIIKAGPWPFAHTFFMETKEHLFFSLLLIASYLPVAAGNGVLAPGEGQRRLLLALAALVVLLGLAMEGSGAITGLGVKVGLMGR